MLISRTTRAGAPPLRAHPPSRRHHRRPTPVRAGLIDGGAGAGALIEAGLIAGAIALSAAPLFTGASARRNAAAAEDARLLSGGTEGGAAEEADETLRFEEEEEADDVKWGAMSVIACVPLLNWLVRGFWSLFCGRGLAPL